MTDADYDYILDEIILWKIEFEINVSGNSDEE